MEVDSLSDNQLSARLRATKKAPPFRIQPVCWDEVWAAWCPQCQDECMPLKDGVCPFCDSLLFGQPTRAASEPKLRPTMAGHEVAA